jgi:NTE family protein
MKGMIDGKATPQRGLVLGAGGTLGAAWMIGALCALEEATGIDSRTVEVIVGTSAGAVVAALLGAGATPTELRDHQFGIPGAGGPLSGRDFDYSSTGGGLPGWPRFGVGSLPLLARWAMNPIRHSPLVALSAVAPPARATLKPLQDLINSFTPADEWSTHPGVQVVAMDYSTGDRAVFDQASPIRTGLAEAVMASCAVPGWFAPVDIDGRRYVDGAVLSPTHAELVAGRGLDEVYILAPMASDELDQPDSMLARCERKLRRMMTRQVLGEANAIRGEGTKVMLLGPGPEDLAAMGGNVMDPARRLPVLQTSLRTTLATLRANAAPAPDIALCS